MEASPSQIAARKEAGQWVVRIEEPDWAPALIHLCSFILAPLFEGFGINQTSSLYRRDLTR